MGMAIDTVATSRTTGGGGADTTFQTAVVAAGDTLTVRNFNPPARAYLERILVAGPAAFIGRVRSPAFHDNVEGLQVYAGENVLKRALPVQARQPLASQDAMVVEMIGKGTSDVNVFALGIFYEDIPGISARLHSWAEIAPLIKTTKYLRITQASGGAEAVWLDTAINVTETLLHANTDYAVLGYMVDTAEGVLALKGIDTGNLRIPFPSSVDTTMTADYFLRWAEHIGGPRIPVFNAANVAGTYLSAFSDEAPASTTNVQLLLAELAHPI